MAEREVIMTAVLEWRWTTGFTRALARTLLVLALICCSGALAAADGL